MFAFIVFVVLFIILFFIPVRTIKLLSFHNLFASLVTAFLVVLAGKGIGAAVVWTFS